jgi:hypothetical protein
MEPQANDLPNPPSDALGSAEYRTRLMTKLNCLIAVLEVAITKIARSMDLPGANEERLIRIRANLENTLAICQRAKQTLERTVAGRASTDPGRTAVKGRMTARDYVELTSIDEYQKFKRLKPIGKDEVAGIDWDDLTRRLGDR